MQFSPCRLRQHAAFVAPVKSTPNRSPPRVAKLCLHAKQTTSESQNLAQLETRNHSPEQRLLTAVAAGLISLSSLPGQSFAALDTKTEEAGVSAKIEGSNISDEPATEVLDKLKNKVLPQAKSIISKVASGEGSNYPASISKELETVEKEINELIEQAEAGANVGNIKSATFGIEEQLNALKAIVGFD